MADRRKNVGSESSRTRSAQDKRARDAAKNTNTAADRAKAEQRASSHIIGKSKRK